MSEATELTGMVLQSVPSGDYDRRVVLLTKERGKITGFARGARRQGSMLQGSVLPFCFGRFKLYEGRSAYTLAVAQIDDYFPTLREDLEGTFYGAYFMELAAYYGRENLDASMMLNLLVVSLHALEKPSLPNRLVRYIYEIRMMVINGEFPPSAAEEAELSPAGSYMIRYCMQTPLTKLYTFVVSDAVLDEVGRVVDRVRIRTIDRTMQSLEILMQMKE